MKESVSEFYEIEELDYCPLCFCEKFSIFACATDKLLRCDDREFLYVKCESCGLIFQKLRPTQNTIAYFYREDYSPYQALAEKNLGLIGRLKRIEDRVVFRYVGLKSVVRRISATHAHHLKEGGVFLDFGCGYGSLLSSYEKKFKCSSIGMDFNKKLISNLRSCGYKALVADDDGWSQVADKSVDLVVMNHVLEHLYDPLPVLRNFRRILKPGGLIDMATPNPQGISAKTFSSDWFALDSPRHIMLYEPSVARALFEKAGFSKIEIHGKPVLKDYMRSLSRRREGAGHATMDVGMFEYFDIVSKVRRFSKTDAYDQYHLLAM